MPHRYTDGEPDRRLVAALARIGGALDASIDFQVLEHTTSVAAGGRQFHVHWETGGGVAQAAVLTLLEAFLADCDPSRLPTDFGLQTHGWQVVVAVYEQPKLRTPLPPTFKRVASVGRRAVD